MFELAADISDLSDCFRNLFNCPTLIITVFFSLFYKYIHRGASALPIKKNVTVVVKPHSQVVPTLEHVPIASLCGAGDGLWSQRSRVRVPDRVTQDKVYQSWEPDHFTGDPG